MRRRDLVAGLAGAGLAGPVWAQAQTGSPGPSLPTAHAANPQGLPAAPAEPTLVTLSTTLGEIEITLDTQGAPLTAAHMLRLFNSSHYVGAAVFRVEPNFLIQLGDLDADLRYRRPPGGTVALETATNRHFKGSVSLARGDDPGSGQSTFYFDMADNAHLNAQAGAPPNTTGYATFGKVTRGMEVLEAIQAAPRDPARGPFPGKMPSPPIVITAVRTNRPPPAPPPLQRAPATKARKKR